MFLVTAAYPLANYSDDAERDVRRAAGAMPFCGGSECGRRVVVWRFPGFRDAVACKARLNRLGEIGVSATVREE